MTLSINMVFPEATPKIVVEKLLLAAVDAMGWANAAWYMEQWSAGRLQIDEKCCAGCAGLKHVPDERGGSIKIDHVSEAIKKGIASCQTAVAMSLGHERAVVMYVHGVSPEQAHEMYRPLVVPDADGAPGYWHVVMQTPEGVDDPTSEMEPGKGIGAGAASDKRRAKVKAVIGAGARVSLGRQKGRTIGAKTIGAGGSPSREPAATEDTYDPSGRPRSGGAPGSTPPACACSGKTPPGERPVR